MAAPSSKLPLLFYKTIGKNVRVAAPKVKNSLPCLWRTEFLVSRPMSRTALKNFFVIKYSSLRNKLRQHIRMIPPAPYDFKNEIGRTITV